MPEEDCAVDANRLQHLPPVNEVLGTPAGRDLLGRFRREFVVRAVREALQEAREALLAGGEAAPGPDELAAAAQARLSAIAGSGPRRVINATGVILHTGLGRAPMPAGWVRTGYCDVEIDRATGERGSRQDHLREPLRWLSGAEDALVVNNNAAATLLAVDTLARGGEVIVARGQLVEIGGSFRMPDVIEASGARLVEVGTTNKVRAQDYLRAATERTALILQVHPSNFRLVGFTEAPDTGELAQVAEELRVPLVYDVGSGCLFDTQSIAGLEAEEREPVVAEAVEAGADVVCFSGDKLLGGPQAGILVGKRGYIGAMARSPLARALRVDKMVLGALGHCLEAHLRCDEGGQPPAERLLRRDAERLRERAEALCAKVRAALPEARLSVEPGLAAPGSGSLPATGLPSWRVALSTDRPEAVARALREGEPGVFPLVREGAVLLDMRTVLDGEWEELAQALMNLARLRPG
jgi:L-seryl-tRNA(Ser) seleniumtransferase